jgi:excisionase family DNA binding protein
MNTPEQELVTVSEIARMFRVSPKTVSRWERQGRIQAIKTPGGHRRFRAQDVQDLWNTANPGVV